MAETEHLLASLDQPLPLGDKLSRIHRVLRARLPFVARIAVAVCDPKTGALRTYLHSSDDENPLPHYQARLADVPSLQALLAERRPRIVNDMEVFRGSPAEHTRRLLDEGYAASYTLPMCANDVGVGFVFFNSRRPGVWTREAVRELNVFGHLIALLVINELTALRTLVAAVSTAAHITHVRDPETGGHLDRISRYARLIAATLASRLGLSDDYVEHIFMFAPLHDIGKIGIPDRVLHKPEALTPAEAALMRTHAEQGAAVIDEILANFGLGTIEHVETLRNIVRYHHERVDGSGYPLGLRGAAIPLEARIVACADVFDALTSPRPYKPAWSVERALKEMRRLAGRHLDAGCVDTLVEQRAALQAIRDRFANEPLSAAPGARLAAD